MNRAFPHKPTPYIVRLAYALQPIEVWRLYGRVLFDWEAWRALLEASFDIAPSAASPRLDWEGARPGVVFSTLEGDDGVRLVTRRGLLPLIDAFAPPPARRSLRATLRRLEAHALRQ